MGTTAWNPIRDTVFFGNQGIYDFGYGAAEFVAAWGLPAKSAFEAARATGLPFFKSLPVFAEDLTTEVVLGSVYDEAADLTFETIVDPQIDRYFGATETGAALKEGGRDALSGVTSGAGDRMMGEDPRTLGDLAGGESGEGPIPKGSPAGAGGDLLDRGAADSARVDPGTRVASGGASRMSDVDGAAE